LSDIIFDTSEQITVLCENLKVQGHDLLLDSPTRRKPGSTGFRRAFVHDQSDGLTINFNKDYPGGVTIAGDIHFTISHQHELLAVGGSHPPDESVNLSDVIKTLRSEIAQLKAQVTQLAAKP
jgi:hypothetical protein